MQLSKKLKMEFPAHIRARGEKYLQEGRISIEEADGTTIWGVARGTLDYQLEATVDPYDGTVLFDCDCPYFDGTGPCKHLWAFVRAIDDAGLWAADEPAAWTTHPEVPRSEELWDRHFAAVEAYERDRTIPQQRGQEQMPPLTYLLDLDQVKRGTFRLFLMYSRIRKDGTPGILRGYRLDARSLPSADDADTFLLSLLLACLANHSSSFYQSGGWANSEGVNIPDGMLERVLPALLASSRLYISDHTTEKPTPLGNPLRDATDEVWTLRMSLQERKEEYSPKGYLACGSRTAPIHAPLVLLRAGWIVWNDRISRLDTSVNFAWILLLRRQQMPDINRKQVDTWLATFHGLATSPEIQVPADLRYEDIQLPLTPVLKATIDMHATKPVLRGQLAFRYGEHEIEEDDPRRVIPLVGLRALLRRDASAEEACLDHLHALDFSRIPSYARAFENEPASWCWETPQGPTALHTLMQKGWDVYLEQNRVRRGSISVSVASGIDWFDVRATSDFGVETVDTPALLEALASGNGLVKLTDGSFGLLELGAESEELGMLARFGSLEEESVRFSVPQVLLLDALLGSRPDVDWDQKAAETRTRLTRLEPQPQDAPDHFVGSLRDYQREGLGWLSYLRKLQLGGCLADDMGLGKTIQALAMLAECHPAAAHPSLVIIPKSLIFNWIDEAARFTPDLRLHLHHGTGRTHEPETFDACDVILTTYGTMRQDIELLRGIPFTYVILDESQAIKNASTATSKAARLLRGSHRLAMSGTPIENHLGELWSLFEFLNPGMLGNASWLKDASGRKDLSDEGQTLISQAVRPFILRRTKEQVASELPPKTEETIYCELPATQRKLYDELREHYRAALAGKIADDGLGRSKIMVLEALLRLRQAACHPALIDDTRSRAESGKLTLLMDMLSDIVPTGHKVLIFSQFTKFLALVKKKLDASHFTYAYLDGKTRNRKACVESFQNDPDCKIFLISLKAGGVGLNLTAADYVILLDPWWNPATEAQAIDRTHRIGQERHVFAYRIVAQNTVEEKILALQESKRDLADSIITQANSLLSRLSPDDLDLLLS